MTTPTNICTQINGIVTYLVQIGLVDDQNWAFQHSSRIGSVEVADVAFQRAELVGMAMKNRTYPEIYDYLSRKRVYNAKMPDGALIQLTYSFTDRILRHHRLAFFPAPCLGRFQDDPDVYLEDHPYVDVVARHVVPFPIRFDYDVRDGICQSPTHPACHLTLGQYEGCRIPVTAPLTPGCFVDFILRHFYYTRFQNYAGDVPRTASSFEDCISATELGSIHLVIPR